MLARRALLKAAAAVPILGKSVGVNIASAGASQSFTHAAILRTSDAYLDPRAESSTSPQFSHSELMKWLRNNPAFRAELRDHIASRTQVTYIDPDLCAPRSYSTAARIYYQRQRNIDRAVDAELNHQTENVFSKWLSIAQNALSKLV